MGVRRSRAVLLATGLSLLAVLASAQSAGAFINDFLVMGSGDGAGSCTLQAGSSWHCDTLRAAIIEANAQPGEDAIGFDGAVQGSGNVITLGSALPAITEQVQVLGCNLVASVRPCTGIDGSGFNVFTVPSPVSDVVIAGLAITGANRGIDYQSGASGLAVVNNRFGITLGGVNDGNVRGIELAGSSAMVGGPGASQRNVFTNNSEFGVHIYKGDDNQILGNYFGVKPDGTTPAPNGENIEVIGDATVFPNDLPTGTAIGAAVAKGNPTRCHSPCNVIAAANGDLGAGLGAGIDLGGEGFGIEAPAALTTIRGNFIGMDATGIADRGNAGNGINVGDADDVTIGGPNATDRNFIGANRMAIEGGGGATNLVIRNNYIGVAPSGTVALPDDLEGVSLLATHATVAANRFGGDGTFPSMLSSLMAVQPESPAIPSGSASAMWRCRCISPTS